ncbi:helix-turn-helix domain-containing protein [Leptospira sp. 'Mane']|uniref:helix-turn-helix domain-containing protein n=1 Tax=Leptospira sp. 'Mane' TaxID=3387407 RepID=UPI00398B97B6
MKKTEVLENQNKTESEELLTSVLGLTIKKRRIELGYSMERVSQISNVSRGMLGLIESGKTTPSIGILWKLSKALRTTIAEMVPDLFLRNPKVIKKEEARVLKLHKGNLEARALHKDENEKLELYEIKVAPGSYPLPSWFENQFEQNVVVLDGNLELNFRDKNYFLESGDSAIFLASDLLQIKNSADSVAKIFWVNSLQHDKK